MKKKTKILWLVLAAVLLVATSILGTMAYLIDSKEVVNTFTVGKVNIKLDEAKVNTAGVPVDEDVEPVDLEEAPRVDNNDYHLLPGHTYVKDPTVTVLEGSDESYVRMLVTINNKTALDTIFAPTGVNLATIFEGYHSSWGTPIETSNVSENTRTYEFRYSTTIAALGANFELPALFTAIKIPSTITGDDLAMLDDFKITVVAHAIQADGFADAAAAWAAFDAQTATP